MNNKYYLECKDFVVGRYDVNISLENNMTYCLASREKDISYQRRFLVSISGVNPNSGICLYEDNNIFDNKKYFSGRVFLDFSRNNIFSLTNIYVKRLMKERYNIDIDENRFKEGITETDLRSEVTIKDEYKFSKYGVNAGSYVLLKSMNVKNIIIDNPFIYLDDSFNKDTNKKSNIDILGYKKNKCRNLIIKEIFNKEKYNNVIIGDCKYLDLINHVDRYIVFGDYNNVFISNPKEDTYLLIDDNIYLKDRIFKLDDIGSKVITENKYTKEELKNFSKCNLKYKVLGFQEMAMMVGLL